MIKDLLEENARRRFDIDIVKCMVCDGRNQAEFNELKLECLQLRNDIKAARDCCAKYKWEMGFCCVFLVMNWCLLVLFVVAILSK